MATRNLRFALFGFMRRNPEVSVGPVKVQKYAEFIRKIAVPTNFNVMNVKPLRGNAVLITGTNATTNRHSSNNPR